MNLYDLPTDGLQLQTPCGGNLTGTNESCVEFGGIPGADGFVLRDTKPEGKGRELRFSTDELDAFALDYIAQRGLTA